ncbi:hypothetical protein C3747_57g91 [Trypanosoma cruzi]|uniref:TET-Associated Glycosyltransferase domain-containing protein n=2 Tax=Trypanosoma cruzi TaxID=5693 RepID=Q4CRM6_TRYCC|nr:hypothetical protein, conserved [Trypanosoma cruzi]EAN82931.1 hypothetical protein, conserved [Trypanosoma cruzi]PWV11735.1 hypothetical protein C3747_57g91 [Trypanosoma cruzi]RNC57408.1 hypothetical protein TcCL_ESM04964 [Trypanosoma cruzi]|eukprot:XP_804782.1 hypothetical protein [Trypanosoma cruzi strain CL Brener]
MWNARMRTLALLEESLSGSPVRPIADGRNDGGVGGIEKLNGHNEAYFCPVFIPSKARYHSERGTISLLIQDKVPFTLVVQPEELTLYEQLVDRLVKKWWGDVHNNGQGGTEDGTDGDELRFLFPRHGLQRNSSLFSQELLSTRPCTPPPPPPLSRRRDAFDVRRLVKIHALPLSDQGVSYVRNYILTELVPRALATSLPSSSSAPRAAQWFWVMDDDIQRFYMAWDEKNHVITPRELFTEVYTRIQELHGNICDMNGIAIFSLEYPRFAYTYGDSDVALNSYNNIASLFRYDLLPPDCKYRFRIREDYDYTLQLINHGMMTARFRNLSFEVPGMAEMAGGMTDYYKTQKEDIRLQNKLFLETWPAVAQECIKGKGALQREDIRVRWDLLHPKRNPDPSATLRCRTPMQKKAHKPLSNGIDETESMAKNGYENTTTIEMSTRKLKGKRTRSSEAAREANKQRNEKQKQKMTLKTKTSLHGKEGEEARRKRVNCGIKRQPPEWKGYALERWRYLTVHEAERLHLHLIPSEKLRVGQTVAVVPPMFDQNPSVVEAVLVDKKVMRRRRSERNGGQGATDAKKGSEVDIVVEWSAVARGLPLLYVTRCYELPMEGVDVAAAAVDAFFEKEWEEEEEEEEDGRVKQGQ